MQALRKVQLADARAKMERGVKCVPLISCFVFFRLGVAAWLWMWLWLWLWPGFLVVCVLRSLPLLITLKDHKVVSRHHIYVCLFASCLPCVCMCVRLCLCL